MKLQLNEENGVLKFHGQIDETVKFEELVSYYKQRESLSAGAQLVVDLSDVKACNSMGIVVWLRFMKSVGRPFKYIHAPVWLVYQFGMISALLQQGSTVESIKVPFYNEEDDEECVRILKIGTDIPILSDYKDFNVPDIVQDGKTYTLDVVPLKYFSFLKKKY